jgi:hypothetical protein
MAEGMGDTMTGGMMQGPNTDRPARNRAAATTETERSVFLRRLSRPEGATVGTMLRGDLTLYTLSGRERMLSTLLAEHRPTVIILGSLSSPSFRDRLMDLPWLAREMGRNGDLLIVYTREQHPEGGDWQVPRNEMGQILIPAHKTLAERIKLAERVRDADGMRGQSVVVDSMDDTLLKAFVGKEAVNRPQNTAVVVSPGGKTSPANTGSTRAGYREFWRG